MNFFQFYPYTIQYVKTVFQNVLSATLPILHLALNSNLIFSIYCLSFLDTANHIQKETYFGNCVRGDSLGYKLLTSFSDFVNGDFSLNYVIDLWFWKYLNINIAKKVKFLYCFWNLMSYIKTSTQCNFNGHFSFLLIWDISLVLFSNFVNVTFISSEGMRCKLYRCCSNIQFGLSLEYFLLFSN